MKMNFGRAQNRSRGFSLLELCIGLALVGLLMAGAMQASAAYSDIRRKFTFKSQALKLRAMLVRELVRVESVERTISHGTNSSFDCIFEGAGTCGVSAKPSFDVVSASSQVQYQGANPTYGQTLSGEWCTTFPSVECPMRYELGWEPICIDNCLQRQVRFTGQLLLDSSVVDFDRSEFKFELIQDVPILPNCQGYKARGATADGFYLIDPDGKYGMIEPFQIYCDMTTDGGGWMLIANRTGGISGSPFPEFSSNLDPASTGILRDPIMIALLKATTTRTENNIRVFIEEPDLGHMVISMNSNGVAAKGKYGVPYTANGDCSSFDATVDNASYTPTAQWIFRNGGSGFELYTYPGAIPHTCVPSTSCPSGTIIYTGTTGFAADTSGPAENSCSNRVPHSNVGANGWWRSQHLEGSLWFK